MSVSSEKNLYETIWQKKAQKNRSRLSDREQKAMHWIQGGIRFLDVGCGDGFFAYTVKKIFGQVYGCDRSNFAISLARDRGVLALLNNVNATYLPFKDDCMDVITALDVVEHVTDPQHFITELHRILKEGGDIVISTPNIRQITRIAALTLKGTFPKTSGDKHGWDGGHLHYFTCKDIQKLLQLSGFQIISVDGIMHLQKYRWLKKMIQAILPKRWGREFLAPGIIVKAKKGS